MQRLEVSGGVTTTIVAVRRQRDNRLLEDQTSVSNLVEDVKN